MKLGFAINTISAGAGNPWSRNDELGWKKYVGDLRPLLSSWSNPNNEPIDFIRFVDEGFLLVSILPISGRPNDLCSYYFFVPRLAQVDGKELLSVAHEFIAANGVVKELEAIASREFPQRKTPFPCKPSSSATRWAMRYYNNEDELSKLIGVNCYQNYYDEFNAIFLLKRGSSVRPVHNSSIVDISDKKIVEVVTMLPPSADTLQQVFGCRNISICFKSKTGELVKLNPLILQRGQSLSLFALRSGYEPLRCVMTADKDYQEGRLQADNVKWMCIIRPDRFVLKTRDNAIIPLNDADISLNGRTLTSDGLKMAEEECINCNVSVSATGYEEWTPGYRPAKVNILASTKIEIFMTAKKPSNRKSSVELADRRIAEILIPKESKGLLKGYYYSDEKKLYRYNSARFWTFVVLAFVAGLLLVTLVKSIGGFFAGFSEKDTLTPEAKITKVTEYFQDNEIYKKEVMCKLDTFPKLFEYINNYQLDSLVPILSAMADSSDKAKDLLDISRGNKGKIVHENSFTGKDIIEYSKYKTSLAEGEEMYVLLMKDKWDKKEFQKYELTQKLFNILNDGTFSELNSLPKSVQEHPKFKRVFEYLSNNYAKDYKFEKNNGHFLPENDSTITIDKYVDVLRNAGGQKTVKSDLTKEGTTSNAPHRTK